MTNTSGSPRSLKGRHLLLVNTGSPKKRFILQLLHKLGITITCLNAEANWAKPYVDRWIITAGLDTSRILDLVTQSFLEWQEFPDGVITFWEDDVLLTSRVAEHLGLPGIALESALTARNKSKFREFCHQLGIPSPRSLRLPVGTSDDIDLNGLRFPLVIKPVFGSSSAFVMRVNNQDELHDTISYIRQSLSIDVESSLHDGLELMIEEYIDGDEVDVDIVVQNGKIKYWSIADNDQTNEPFFIETGDCAPTRLPADMQTRLVELADEVLERLHIQNGCIHFEAKVTQKGPVPIELNLRMGGDQTYSFSKAVWGYDLVEAAVAVAMGIYLRPYTKPAKPLTYLRGKYFLSPHSGVLSQLKIPDDLKKRVGVQDFVFFKSVGDIILAPPEGYEYLGWLTAEGATPQEAEANLEKVFSEVKYEVARFKSTSTLGKTERRSPLSLAHVRKRLLLGAARAANLVKLSKNDQRRLRVGIACNQYTENNSAVEQDLTSVGKNIEQALAAVGYEVRFLDFNDPGGIFSSLQKDPVDIVFNVCERINDSSLLEPHAAAILDVLQIPYTGSNPFTLGLCIDKIRVKKLLAFHDIPTPRWDYCYTLEESIDDSLRFPRIVKPANSDNSLGITNESVVTNERDFRRQLEKVVVEYGRPALIEEYIEGDEFDVSVIGNDPGDLRVLPLSRSIFDAMPEGYWHIYPYEAKFSDDPAYTTGITVQRPPRNVSRKLLALISEIALDTYNILGCSDYGRVELRVDADGNPYILELNPNPSINLGDCLPSVAELAGMSYSDFLEEIIRLAITRFKDRPPYYHLQSNIL